MAEEAAYAYGSITRPEMRELRRLSDRAGLLHFAGHLALLGAAAYLVALAPSAPARVAAQALEGAILIFLFAPLHESIHRTAFRSRGLNDGISAVIGFLLLLPAGYFRYFHFAHHRHTQDPVRDPELATPKPATLGRWLWVASGFPLWRDLTLGLLRHAAGKVSEPYLSAIPARRVILEARIHLALYGAIAVTSVAFGNDLALRYWVIPAVLGQPWLRLYLMAEHTGCPLVPDMLANSRTTLTNGMMRFLAWNMPFHAEHHCFPAVPFHALPRLHQRLAPGLRKTSPGYIAAQREILKTLG